MTKIIAVANQKGGVAKTTSAIAIASLLGQQSSCLVVDLDPQANLTDGLGVRGLPDDQLTSYDLLNRQQDPNPVILSLQWGIDLIPADIGLAQKEGELVGEPDSHYILEDQLKKLSQYDFIVIDCPPSLGRLTYSALTAADLVLIPVQCQYFSAKGYQQLLNTIQVVQSRSNPNLRILGVLPTMFDSTNISRGAVISIQQIEGVKVFESVLRSVKFSESQLAGYPIDRYLPANHTPKESEALAEKLLPPYRDVVDLIQVEAFSHA